MEITLSFVVPVYNVGYHKLSRCLDSLTKAMKLMKKSEIVIVNDASPKWDEEYGAIPEGENIQVISHVENRGLGATRNTGLKYASGNWVWFVDSDDCIRPGVMTNIQGYFRNFPDTDVFQLGAFEINSEGVESSMYFNSGEFKEIQGLDILNSNEIVPPCIWSKIYRRRYLIENNLRNPEGTLYEDQEFLVRTALTCGYLRVIPVVGYKYHENQGSIMNSDWDLRHVFDAYKVISTCMYLLREIPEEMKSGRLNEYKLTWSKAESGYKNLSWREKIKYHIKVILWNQKNPH